MKSALAVIGISSITASLVGCTLEREYMDPNANNNVFGGEPAYYQEGNVDIQQASVRGDIGPIRQFDDRQATGYGYDDPEFGSSQITLNATTNEGTGLVMLYLDRSIQDLPLGRTVMQGSNDDFSGNYVQLCSDRSDGSVHFDGIAEEVVIDVAENEAGVRDVNIDATITEGFEGTGYDNPETTVVTSNFRITQ
jgi:hypothetical protein